MAMLAAGDKAPDYLGSDQEGKKHFLSDHSGKKLVIFFFPKADTPGCTAEACDLRNNIERFASENYAILGISADSEAKQKKFKEKYQLPYPLIADVEKQIINAFGVWGPKKFLGRSYEGILRTTFIIDENGMVSEVISDVKTKAHAAQILKN